MDLITPARAWALAEAEASAEQADAAQPFDTPPRIGTMPPLQRVVMFLSVVGPFVGFLAAIVLLWRRGPFGVGGIGWGEVAVMLAMYGLCGFGVTIGFHRLLTHRSFETYRPVRLALAVLGSAAAQGMAIRWCATHRRHHQRSDCDGDPHSPHTHANSGGGALHRVGGMWHAHVGWCFDAHGPGRGRSVPDLLADRAMLWIDRLYFLWIALVLRAPAAALGLYARSWHGFASGMIWGGFVRVCLMQHVTWSINSVCHVWGGRPFRSGDHSANNFPTALLSLGAGWHNNHHAFPTSARHGLRWWQFDASWVVIRGMRRLGLAWEVRVPNEAAIEAKRREG